MEQKRYKMPDGSVQTFDSREAAVAAAQAMSKTRQSVLPPPLTPPPKGNLLQRGLTKAAEFIRGLPAVPGVAIPEAAQRFVRDEVAAVPEMLAHPIDNAPALAAAAATTAVPLLRPARPALARLLTAPVAGTLGGLVRGDSMADAALSGSVEGAVQGVGELLPLIKPGLNSVSRRATRAGLRPDRAALDAMRNPITGRQFDTPGEAATHFAERALTIEPKGSPGSVKYAKNLIEANTADRKAKVGLLNLDPQVRVPETDITAPGTFDTLVEAIAKRSAGETPTQQVAKIDDLVKRILTRSEVIPMSSGAISGAPRVTPGGRVGEWSLPDLDQLMGGLQDDIQKYMAAANAAQMTGSPIPDDLEMRAKTALRSRISKLIEQAAPVVPGQPSVADLNKRIAERIPFETAAIDATVPAGESMPRLRMSLGAGGAPRPQIFDYFRGASGATARPLKAMADALPALDGMSAAQMLRLLIALNTQGTPEGE